MPKRTSFGISEINAIQINGARQFMKSSPTNNSVQKPSRWRSPALKISLIYMLIAGIWILVSDSIVLQLTTDPDRVHLLNTLKGWGFVLVSGLMLFGLIQGWFSRLRKSEAELRASEERYRNFIMSSPDAIYLHTDGQLTLANPAMCQLLGAKDAAELLGRRVLEIVHPDYHDQVRERWKQVFAHQPVPLAEQRFIRLDGSLVAVEVSAALADSHGRQEVQVIARDITERKQAESALHASEERWRSIVNTSPDGISIVSMTGQIQAVSGKLLAMHGFEKPEELIGRHMYEFVDPAYHEKATTLLQEMLRGNYTGPAEYLLNRKDGSQFYTEINAEVLRDEHGTPNSIFFIERDITERKRAETALRQSEEQFRRAVMDSPCPIMLHAEDGAIIQVSQAWCDLSGYAREEFNTVDEWVELAHANVKALAQIRIKELFRLNGPKHGSDYTILTKSSGRRIWEFSSAPLGQLPDGRRLVISTALDVTERRQAEAIMWESEGMFRSMVEALPLIIFVCSGPEHKSEYINPAFTRLLGYTLKDLPTVEQWWPLAYPDEIYRQQVKTEWEKRVQRAIDTKIPIEPMEALITCKDGSQKYFSVGFIPLANKNYVVGVDLTERKAAEAALRESEFFFKESQQAASIGSYKCNFKSGFWESSEVLDQIFGIDQRYSRSVESWVQLVHPDDRTMMANYLQEVVIGQRLPFNKVYRIVRLSDGQTRWVHGLGRLDFDAAGNVASLIGVIQDITERRMHEIEIERTSRLYAALSQINQCIVQVQSREELFAQICQTLVKFGRFQLAWLGWINPSTREIQIVAQDGEAGDYLKNLQIYADDRPEGRGITGTCIREGRTYVCNDFANDPVTGPWRAEAARHGVAAAIAVPVRFAGEICGALMVYAKEKNFFGEKEIGLLEEAVADISFALDHFEAERQRRQAEAAFVESRNFLDKIFNCVADPVFVKDRQHCLVMVNDAFCAFNGHPREELLGKSGQDFLLQAEAEAFWEKDNLVLATGEENISEERQTTKHNGVCTVITSKTRYTDDQGESFIVGIIHDITERKRVDSQLRLLSQAVEQTPITVVITDATGNIEYVNPQFTRVTGYTFEEAKGKNPRVLKSGETPASVYQELWASITSGREWVGILCNRKKNGELYWEDVSIAPVLNAEGHIGHFIALKQDITARREAEEQIRNQARLLDLARDTVVVCEADGKLSYWNKSFEQLTGWTTVEGVGRSLSELLRGDAIELDIALSTTRKTGEWTGELTGESRSGRRFTLLSRWSLVREKDDAPGRILSINTDITEKKQIEAQFLRSQRLESIGSLASGIAHDLNNILSPIMLCAPMLNDDLAATERREMVAMVEQSARRAADIVRQLLSFSRGKEGQKVPLQFRHLVREMGKIVTETFPRSLRFETACGDNLWPVLGNVTQLHQVLLNLCVNARDAMPDGGRLMVAAENIRLDPSFVTMHPEASVGPFLRVRVSDSGQGIPEGIRDKIFDPFFTTKPVGQGTGLGLATVFSIVKEHGGFLTFQSEVGKGTTFEFYLPALPENELRETSSPTSSQVARGQGELVLVVDDELPIGNATAQGLRLHGYEVVVATNGIEALKQFNAAAGRVRLVVTDLSMPLMDGAMLCRALRGMSPNTPIIVTSGGLTGPAALDYFRTLGELEITHILNKPHTAEVLLRMMDEILHLTPPPK